MVRERPPRSLRSRLPLTRGRAAEGGRGSPTHHLQLELGNTASSDEFLSSRIFRSFHLRLKIILQCDSVIVFGVTRTVNQGDRPTPGSLNEAFPYLRLRIQFSKVPLAKDIPFFGVMSKPST